MFNSVGVLTQFSSICQYVFPFIVDQALASRRGVPSSPRWATQWMGSVGNPCDPSLAPHHP